MAAALRDTLIQCIAGEKEEASPIVIENKIKELETEFDRLLVLAVDENDIIDHKLKHIFKGSARKQIPQNGHSGEFELYEWLPMHT